MKKSKRILAFFATLCLALSMTVPAVWAEEAESTSTETYNFDFFAEYAQINGEGELPSGYKDDKYGGYRLKLSSGKSSMQTLYGEGLNWTYTDQSNAKSVGDSTFYTKDYVTVSKYADDAAKRDSGFLRMPTAVGEWIAFTIKTPGTDTMWNITLKHVMSHAGATKCNIYILPGAASNDEITQKLQVSDWLVGDVNFYKSKDEVNVISADAPYVGSTSSNVGLWESGNEQEYTVVLYAAEKQADATSAIMYLSQLVMEPVVATVGDTAYTGAAAAATAINAATNGTVTLYSALETNETVTVNPGVILNLNGQKLTANKVQSAGDVIDSSDGNGLIVTDDITLKGDNSQLPLRDNANSGYRFFKATLKSLTPEAASGETQKFWFRLSFTNSSAYDLIIAGTSGLEIGANLSWSVNGQAGSAYAHPDISSNFYSGWANAAKGNSKVAIGVTINGIDKVTDFTFVPTVKSNGVTVQ